MDLASAERTLQQLTERLEALERDHVSVQTENHALRNEVATLKRAASAPASQATSSAMERLTRRVVLRRAMQATAASVAAGVLLQRETQQAEAADGTFDNLTATNLNARNVWVTNPDA